MTKTELKALALEAIVQYETSIFAKAKSEAQLQVAQDVPLGKDFPIPAEFIGRNHHGKFVYNFSAKAILQHIERHEQEFVI